MNNLSEKEIIHRFDILEQESFYTRPMSRDIGAVGFFLFEILLLIISVEQVIKTIACPSLPNLVMLSFPVYFVYDLLSMFVIAPIKLKKSYQGICATHDNHPRYTFYSDCVNVKRTTREETFDYCTAEGIIENESRLIIIFPYGITCIIDKAQCSAEQLSFIRSVIPDDIQREHKRKASIKYHLMLIGFIAIAIYYTYTTILLFK